MKFACPECKTRYSIPDEKLPNAATLRFTCKKCNHPIRVRRKSTKPTPASAGEAPSQSGPEQQRPAARRAAEQTDPEAAATHVTPRPSFTDEPTPAPASAGSDSSGAPGEAAATHVTPRPSFTDEPTPTPASASEAPSQSGPEQQRPAARRAAEQTDPEAAATHVTPRPSFTDEPTPTPAAGSAATDPNATATARRPGFTDAVAGGEAGQSGATTQVTTTQQFHRAPQQAAAGQGHAAEQKREWFVLVAGQQKGPVSKHDVLQMLGRRQIDARTYVWRKGMPQWQRLGSVEALQQAAAAPAESAGQPAAAPSNASAERDSNQLDPNASPFADATVPMTAARLNDELAKLRAESVDQPAAEAQDLTPFASEPAEAPQSETAQHPQQRQAPPPAATATAAPANAGAAVGAEPTPQPQDAPDESRTETRPGAIATSPPPPHTEPSPARANAGAPPSAAAPHAADAPPSAAAPHATAAPHGTTAPPSAAAASSTATASKSGSNTYMQAPPGEATRVFMATAGLYRRKRNQKVMAAAIGLGVLALATPIALDIAGIWTMPAMGLVYDYTGLEDPNKDRAARRVRSKLADSELSKDEREQLRSKLLGLTDSPKNQPQGQKKPPPTKAKRGLRKKKTLNEKERSLAASVFADKRKKEQNIRLTSPERIQTPNLPEGLTQEAIFEVIEENNRAMKLCVTEALREGQELDGKMTVSLTINPKGRVDSVQIETMRYRRTTMGKCTAKRLKSWRFPRFNGEPLTVVFPYVLSGGP